MKITTPSARQARRIQRHASGVIALLLVSGACAVCETSVAQSAMSRENTGTHAAVAAPAPTDKPAAQASSTPMEATAAVGMASRFITPQDLGPYMKTMTNLFSMRDRDIDPFGQPQDPDSKPIVKPEVNKKSTRITQIKATPFADIVQLIKVTTIMPAEKRFLIGTRSIREGQKFPINFRSKPINVLVVSVSSRQILLRNIDSNENAALDLNLLPVGMTPGNKGITAPGMIQDSPNSAIDLDGEALPGQQTVNQ